MVEKIGRPVMQFLNRIAQLRAFLWRFGGARLRV